MTPEAPKRPHRRTRPLPVAVPTGRRKTVLNSDSLTGQFLEAGRPTYVVATPDSVKKTPPRYLEATGGELHPPTALHRNVTDEGGLGGLVYTVMMLQYLRYATDAQSRAEQLELISWWRSDYGRRRVMRGLERKIGAERARHTLEVVLACHQEQADPADIAERFSHSVSWVCGRIDWCMKLALGHRTDCQCATCEAREA